MKELINWTILKLKISVLRKIMSKELEDTSQGENIWENISDKGLLSKIFKQLNNKAKKSSVKISLRP